jgi:hypothetical protein
MERKPDGIIVEVSIEEASIPDYKPEAPGLWNDTPRTTGLPPSRD